MKKYALIPISSFFLFLSSVANADESIIAVTNATSCIQTQFIPAKYEVDPGKAVPIFAQYKKDDKFLSIQINVDSTQRVPLQLQNIDNPPQPGIIVNYNPSINYKTGGFTGTYTGGTPKQTYIIQQSFEDFPQCPKTVLRLANVESNPCEGLE